MKLTRAKVKVESVSEVRQATKRKRRSVPPEDWLDVYERIRDFRKSIVAPVDTMGCEKLGDDEDAKVSRFQTLVSLMLSSQTKDAVTAAAVANLKRDLPGGLTVQSVIAADSETFEACISKVGFHSRKTGYIKAAAKILEEKHNGDVPDTIEGLVALPGVGPKMGYLALHSAWKINAGIGVDVHVHRISNRLGWVKTADQGPEATRKALESFLTRDLWKEVNAMLVGFGQTVCLPRGPRCDACPVADACPSRQRIKHKVEKVEIKQEIADVEDLGNNFVDATIVKMNEEKATERGKPET